ncbi:chlorosome envelope protein B [Prosthecochloris sp. N3]|uniref:Chlorosome envelope protein B n=1 Tax=Prosthecochloris ethylica TaxID=2743976 RepID=A0ABR9XQX3_9CHLB|nr:MULTISPECIES: chlorosome envelope protein B [Prosthecochloris]MBF0586387.1 chlorosome envelope protein B [Prosthecochloris ethylica]MBF0636395.1 chlorosome envelope protein B [Prosthecochloris ethylica]NUK47569.1 chlorosome envelope protein B [Prosthecochloris ethylica]RNA64183.1 chlorosome envelope protein B [Prosthecochloris sp. ZM_2]
MSNGSNTDLSGAISGLVDTIGKLGQTQIEILNNTLKAMTDMVEPMGKTATDLVGTVANTMNDVLKNVSSAIGGGNK